MFKSKYIIRRVLLGKLKAMHNEGCMFHKELQAQALLNSQRVQYLVLLVNDLLLVQRNGILDLHLALADTDLVLQHLDNLISLEVDTERCMEQQTYRGYMFSRDSVIAARLSVHQALGMSPYCTR